MDQGAKDQWEMERRKHLERQPHIKNEIIESIKKDPRRTWVGIEADINHWCSASCIRRWVTSWESFTTCTERIIPLLSSPQRQLHQEFAKLFIRNWGLGGGKWLLIHYDEKWFWGMVLRCGAKMCAELGIDYQSMQAYHKNHINKCMGVAFVGYAFEDRWMSSQNNGSS